MRKGTAVASFQQHRHVTSSENLHFCQPLYKWQIHPVCFQSQSICPFKLFHLLGRKSESFRSLDQSVKQHVFLPPDRLMQSGIVPISPLPSHSRGSFTNHVTAGRQKHICAWISKQGPPSSSRDGKLTPPRRTSNPRAVTGCLASFILRTTIGRRCSSSRLSRFHQWPVRLVCTVFYPSN